MQKEGSLAELFEEIAGLLREGRGGALATLVKSRGSVPMSHRARLLVRDDGAMAGTIGGGCLEADVWQQARRVMRTGVPKLLHFALNHDAAAETGLTCGGNVDIFVEAIHEDPARTILPRIARLRRERQPGVRATVIHVPGGCPLKPGAQLLMEGSGALWGDLGLADLKEPVLKAARESLESDRPRLLGFDPHSLEAIPSWKRLEGVIQIFLDPLLPDPTLFLFGGGHVGYFTARLAHMVGFRIVVIDDRQEFANRERFPEADACEVGPFEQIVSRLPIEKSSYIVIATRGHKHDATVLAQVLDTPAGYIGMIGSRRKAKVLFDDLIAKGIPPERLKRVHTPVGLAIGADTPEEVAVSIVAEMIQRRRQPPV